MARPHRLSYKREDKNCEEAVGYPVFPLVPKGNPSKTTLPSSGRKVRARSKH